MPIGWAGVQDTDHASPPYKTGEEGMQQIYVGPELTRGNSCGHTRWVPWPDGKQPVPGPAVNATDHESYQLDLYPTAAPSRGVACYRDVPPAGYTQGMARLGGYVFHKEPHAGWTGPAAVRLALSMRLRQDPSSVPEPRRVYRPRSRCTTSSATRRPRPW